MTKHAVNAFLATSVAFINELARICEVVGADAKEVERGLKSEQRIGPRAYLGPGDAFAGGTLARDIGFLRGLARHRGLPAHVFAGVADGNAAHKHWTRRKLLGLLAHDDAEHSAGASARGALTRGALTRGALARGASAQDVSAQDAGERQALAGRCVAVWGLTYKPGTDTLRRSSAIELCRWLLAAGARVRAHDPAVSALPADLANGAQLCLSPLDADYSQVPADQLVAALARAHVVDPAGVLYKTLATHPQVRYLRVGAPPDIRVRRTAEAGVVAAAPRGEWAPGGEPAVSGDVREGTR
jgi:UDPglucose 6-dehydrogenase